MSRSNLTVSVVIPSWNSESQMKTNLKHVFTAATEVNADIIIVDDASQHDDSSGYLKGLAKEGKIKFFENSHNAGFSYTVNKGVSKARGDIIMLLNTDVRPSKDCFANSLRLFKSDVFAVTFNSGEAWAGGEWKAGMLHHFKVDPTKANKDKTNHSLWASGGQAAFDRKKWNILGGMDLLYKPFYWEDTDLGYRAWKRGWKIIWDPTSRVIHDHKKSVIASNFSPKYITNTAQRNQFLFIWKNIHDTEMIREHLLYLPKYFFSYPIPLLQALAKIIPVLTSRIREIKNSVISDKELLSKWQK